MARHTFDLEHPLQSEQEISLDTAPLAVTTKLTIEVISDRLGAVEPIDKQNEADFGKRGEDVPGDQYSSRERPLQIPLVSMEALVVSEQKSEQQSLTYSHDDVIEVQDPRAKKKSSTS